MRIFDLAPLWKRAGVVLFVLLLNAAVHAQITPSQDAYTNSAAPKTNYGANALLNVADATQISYVQFNLSSIPSGATVSQATLKLYVNSVTTVGSFNVDYVLGPWSESTITYSLAPALGNTIVSGVTLTAASKNQYILINITPAVEAWLNGNEPNDGIALVANSTFNASFDSKENTGTSHPPELDIVFSGGTITGVTTSVGSGLTGGGTSGTLNLSLETNCASGQVLEWNGNAWACSSPGGIGTITGVTAGTGLTGGGTNGNVGLSVNEGVVAFQSDLTNGVNAAETFATTAATTAQNTAEAYANSTFVPLAGGTMTGALNLPSLNATNAVSGNSFNVGSNVFDSGNYANFNAFLGYGGNATMTGTANTATGYQAMIADTTGMGNTANGTYALFSNTTGSYNVGFGGGALYANVSGLRNTATGGRALYSATTSDNTADGHAALFSTTTGSNNTAVGSQALYSNVGGSYNTALGYFAATDQISLTNATAIGAKSDVTQSNSLVLGSIAGVNSATASTNVGIGTTAPQYTLDVEAPSGSTPTVNFGSTSNPAALTVNGTAIFSGLVSFSSGQTFPGTGSGTITGVTAGTGLTGGGANGTVVLNVDTTKVVTGVAAGTALTGGGMGGNVTVNLDTTQVPLLNASNFFTGNQTVNGNLSAAGLLTGTGFQIGSNLFAFGSYAAQNAFLGFAGNTTMTKGGNTGVGFNALLSNISGEGNSAVGNNALTANTTGLDNTATGDRALTANTTGYGNTAAGGLTLWSNTTGTYNTALGFLALESNTTGQGSTAAGYGALQANTASFNSAFGYALTANTTGGGNTAMGYNTLNANTTGQQNTADGGLALNSSTGNSDTAMGYQALMSNTSGSYNTALGYDADVASGTFTNATAIGANAQVGESNALVLGSINGVNGATASTNVGIGTTAPQYALDVHGTANFTGPVNFASGQTFPGTGSGTITGVSAGTDLTGGGTSGIVTLNVDTTKVITGVTPGTALTGGGTSGNVTLNLDTTQVPLLNAANTFTGNQTVNGNLSATGLVTGTGFQIGSNLFAFGSIANYSAFLGFAGNTTTTGTGDTGIGYDALANNTTGRLNTASGGWALVSNTTGNWNTATGANTLIYNTTGGYNTANGALALYANTTGGSNTANGTTALYANTTGSSNTANGNNALFSNTTGSNNTADGDSALVFNTTGQWNTAIGYEALNSNATGNNNTAAGVNAGMILDSSAITGSNNTFLGYDAAASTGTLTNATAVGANAEVGASNALVLGSIGGVNYASASTNVGIGTTTPQYALDVHGTANFTGLVNFASGQTFPGSGTVSGVTAGTDLTGGGTSGNVTLNVDTTKVVTGVTAGTGLTGGGAGGALTLNLDTTKVPQLAAANTFTAAQTINAAGTALTASGGTYGVSGTYTGTGQGAGVYGTGYFGVLGSGATGVWGTSPGGTGVWGSGGDGGIGVAGDATGTGYAGSFQGNVKVTGNLGIGGDTPMSHSPRMTFSGTVASFNTASQPAGFFMPDQPITITRMNVAVGYGQSGPCTGSEAIRLQTPNTTYNLLIPSTGFYDSGPLTLPAAAGSQIQINGIEAPGLPGCQSGNNITVTVQYMMQ